MTDRELPTGLRAALIVALVGCCLPAAAIVEIAQNVRHRHEWEDDLR